MCLSETFASIFVFSSGQIYKIVFCYVVSVHFYLANKQIWWRYSVECVLFLYPQVSPGEGLGKKENVGNGLLQAHL